MNTRLITTLALVACAEAAPSDTGEVPLDPCTDCALTDAETFTYAAELSAEVVPVASRSDVRVRWDGLTQDVHGHARGERFEIEQALLIAFMDLTPDEVLEQLATDSLNQSSVALYATCTPQDDGCDLTDFNVFGRTFELDQYFTQGSGTWLIVLSSSYEAGGHAYLFLEPRDDATATTAAFTDDSSAIDVDVDLGGRTPVPVVVDADSRISWDTVTRDGLGNPLAVHQIDRMVVGMYREEELGDLEQSVFDLETLADPLWEMDVSGLRSATLDELAAGAKEDLRPLLKSRSSLVALYCSTCMNPAPRIVAVLDPREP